ncbi:hypothetical protein HFD88_005174 [Aspergillus terreus]|nr:hypothetical protein HFD88_005174 [Aspergillus terreus]
MHKSPAAFSTMSAKYVQGLEARVRDLERRLASAVASSSCHGGSESQFNSFPTDPAMVDFSTSPGVDAVLENLAVLPTIPVVPSQERSESLVDELKLLSLEATAERHLGSSSGLSFARLTQAVLRRLSPDKAEFVFDGEPEIDPHPEQSLAWSPGSIIGPSGVVDFDASLLYNPSLFNELPMPHLAEHDTVLADLNFPDRSHINYLIEFYFAHSHTLYPIIRRNEFLSTLWRIYADPTDPLAQSPLWLFRIWMVLAIGSTTHSSVSLVDESESVLYYNKAMVYFEAAFGYGDMAALEVLMLQVSYSFFNQIGPNTWFLVGVAARMAIGMGLHTATTYESLPTDIAEYRKRILFSLYMMDRVVSMALGRPFAIHDDDVDVAPFADVDDENIHPDGIVPHDGLQPSSMAVPLHILSLRKIASDIANNVYSTTRTSRMSPAEREETLQAIHRKLVDWRRNMPFPLPDVHSQVPHLSSSWFDLNYYTHVAMLYRPSPLFPTLDQSKVKVLAMAAAMSIRQAINMHRQRRFAYNWLNLLGVFTSTLSLMYAITAQPDNLASVLGETKAVDDLELAIELLDTFGRKFPAAKKIRRMVQEVLKRFQGDRSKSNMTTTHDTAFIPSLAYRIQAGQGSTILGIAGVIALLSYLIYKTTVATDIPFIKGLPEIPGAVPVFGHLLKLGDDHATVCEKWWRQYGHSVFQIRLGNTRAVVVNSFEDCRKMLLGHQNAIIDRPTLYTFHGVISSTQGFTIGSSPWDESCKKKRKAAGTALGRPALRSYYPMFDLESYCIVRDLHRDSRNGEVELNVRPYIQRYALNTTLTLCYGIRMDAVYDELLREILYVGSAISLLRSASENLQDYIPLLRYLPNNEKNARSKSLRERRDKYLDLLLDKVRDMIKKGTDKPCISSAILKDEETKLNGVEVSSICLSLVSGGFETIPGTLTSAIGSLSTKEGQVWQDRAYEDIKRHYPDIRDAWTSCFVEEKVPYVNAIIKEAGRYYTVSAMSLPRKTVTEINWNGAIIPPKTMVLINAQAGNHDVDHFGPDGGKFDPERWLKTLDPPTERETSGLNHLSFGAGSRACSGQYIASRLLYAALVRILSSYKIVASETEPPNTDYVDYNQFKTALVAIPRDFKVKLVPRDPGMTAECLETAELRTREHYKE